MKSMTNIRVGIVDDEPLACAEMRRLLGMFDDVQIEFEVANAEDALKKFVNYSLILYFSISVCRK